MHKAQLPACGEDESPIVQESKASARAKATAQSVQQPTVDDAVLDEQPTQIVETLRVILLLVKSVVNTVVLAALKDKQSGAHVHRRGTEEDGQRAPQK